jgi:LemA protein
MEKYAVLIVVLIIGFYFILIFNRLVKNWNLVNEGWSEIDFQLKRRHDLIPKLVDTVKAYAAHERNLFDHITELRMLAQKKRGFC